MEVQIRAVVLGDSICRLWVCWLQTRRFDAVDVGVFRVFEFHGFGASGFRIKAFGDEFAKDARHDPCPRPFLTLPQMRAKTGGAVLDAHGDAAARPCAAALLRSVFKSLIWNNGSSPWDATFDEVCRG